MQRRIIFYQEYFIDFYKPLDLKLKEKIKYTFELIKTVQVIPIKFLSPLKGYEGLYEIRIEYQSNIYRIFCCFDKDQLVVLFNGFQKKSQKTPKKEIKLALQLKNEYFNSKKTKKYDRL